MAAPTKFKAIDHASVPRILCASVLREQSSCSMRSMRVRARSILPNSTAVEAATASNFDRASSSLASCSLRTFCLAKRASTCSAFPRWYWSNHRFVLLPQRQKYRCHTQILSCAFPRSRLISEGSKGVNNGLCFSLLTTASLSPTNRSSRPPIHPLCGQFFGHCYLDRPSFLIPG
jgi:hypothetical protein